MLCLLLAVLMALTPVEHAAAATSAEMLVTNSFTTTSKVYSSSSGKTITSTYYHNNTLKNYKLFKGIDVSKWQSDSSGNSKIDWAKAHADGIDFAFVRVAARGSISGALSEDTTANDHITKALANNINVGVYIFSQAITTAEAKEEANYVLDILKKNNWNITMPVVFDYEFYTGGRLVAGKLTKTQMTNICAAFCEVIEEAGYQPLIYANYTMCKTYLNTATLAKSYPIWLARYNKTTTSNTLSSSTATPYADITYPYEFWQFTSSGRVDGYSGNLDCNYWYKNTAIKTEDFITTGQTATSISLDWSFASDAMGYRVYRYNPETESYQKVADTQEPCYEDTGLEPGTEYKYKVRCYWTIGGTRYYGTYSDILTVGTKPEKVADLRLQTRMANSITLQFDPVENADGYRVYKYNSTSGAYEKVGDITDPAVTSYKVSGLTSCTEYKFKVRAYKTIGGTKYWGSYSAVLTDTTRPAQGKELAATTTSATEITLNWNKVARADGYKVYRYDTATDSWKCVKTITGNTNLTYTDTKLLGAKEYRYKVCAYKTYGGTTVYGYRSAEAAGTTKPAKVANLAGTSASKKTVTLTWDKVVRATGYKVYRYDEANEKWVLLKTVTGNSTFTYKDTGLTSGKSYKYRVRAYKTYNSKTYYGLYATSVTVKVN